MTARRVTRRGRSASTPALSARRRVAWLVGMGATVTVSVLESSVAELQTVQEALDLVTEARELLAEEMADHRRSCLRRSASG